MDPGPHPHAVDQRTCSSERLAEDEAGRRRRPRGIEAQRPAGGPAAGRRRRAPPGARGASRCRRAARARRRGAGARSRGSTSKRSGSGNAGRVAVGRGDRDADEVAARGSRRRRARRRASRTGRPSPRPARAAATPRSRWAAGPGRRSTSARWSGLDSRCTTALAIMPSVVSMPPKSITAAFETTCCALEAAGVAGGVGEQRRPGLAVEHGLDGGRSGRRRPRCPRAGPPRRP